MLYRHTIYYFGAGIRRLHAIQVYMSIILVQVLGDHMLYSHTIYYFGAGVRRPHAIQSYYLLFWCRY